MRSDASDGARQSTRRAQTVEEVCIVSGMDCCRHGLSAVRGISSPVAGNRFPSAPIQIPGRVETLRLRTDPRVAYA